MKQSLAPRGLRPSPARPSARGFFGVHGGSRCRAIRVPGRVDLRVLGPFDRQRFLGEDCVHRALGLARAAIDALVRVDEELPISAFLVMDAVDRTDLDTGDVEHVDARLSDHVGHSGFLLLDPGPVLDPAVGGFES